MTKVKTEFTSMIQHDGLVTLTIARRAFELYDAGGLRHGSHQDHWYQAEQELAMQGSDLTIETDRVTLLLQVAIQPEKSGQILASISPLSVVLFTIAAEPIVVADDSTEIRKLVRYISLPQEVIPEQVTAYCDYDCLTLCLPILSPLLGAAQSA